MLTAGKRSGLLAWLVCLGYSNRCSGVRRLIAPRVRQLRVLQSLPLPDTEAADAVSSGAGEAAPVGGAALEVDWGDSAGGEAAAAADAAVDWGDGGDATAADGGTVEVDWGIAAVDDEGSRTPPTILLALVARLPCC